MTLNNDKLHTDILIKLHNTSKTKGWLCEKLGFSYGVLDGLPKGVDTYTGNTLKIVEWLDSDINDYIIKKIYQ